MRRRGTPLVVLALLLGGWVSLRAATWDNPLALQPIAQASAEHVELAHNGLAHAQPVAASQAHAPQSFAFLPAVTIGGYPLAIYPPGTGHAFHPAYPPPAAYAYAPKPYVIVSAPAYPEPDAGSLYHGEAWRYSDRRAFQSQEPRYALAPELAEAHRMLMREAFAADWHTEGVRSGGAFSTERSGKTPRRTQEARPPFAAQVLPIAPPSANRWMLDVYGFYRQGSSALSVTQGRAPIYGASQLAANLQWRARPSSGHDPRVYARAYHALVTGGESELAGGVSALPIGDIPVRLYAELRATRNPAISDAGIAARTNVRPAAYAATEIPPIKLPLGFSLEAYGAGGYVGGDASTYFLDGQTVMTRGLTRIGKPGVGSAAVSLGAGVWGGAQQGAQRVDVGPTLRFDVNIGDMPARVSVDYREQVAGKAEPDSGVAATVSTRF